MVKLNKVRVLEPLQLGLPAKNTGPGGFVAVLVFTNRLEGQDNDVGFITVRAYRTRPVRSEIQNQLTSISLLLVWVCDLTNVEVFQELRLRLSLKHHCFVLFRHS